MARQILPTHLHQTPIPGTCRLLYRGDVIPFTLSLDVPAGGNAWIRTNIGSARITRQEIIREVETGDPPLGRDWFDIPLKRLDDRRFEARLALTEVGHFEAKCFFLPEGTDEPLWPEGPNVQINVSPWQTCCANSIYNAFVRQFGPNKNGAAEDAAPAKDIHVLDQAGYHVIPPSGTFRDLIRELDFIIGTLGCRFIQLLPIFPTPTTYGRMGRFGSPYAALSFSDVDSALAQFDLRATPLDQFIELVDAVHTRHGRIIIDIAINHTGWAARLHETHPEWLSRKQGGEIEVPGAWGVQWADLTRLDYTHRDLWTYMAEVFLKWCKRGVDGFRCDAGYMIPLAAWRYMISTVREQFPDTVFFLEGLGGKRSVTRNLLNRGNFDWAYSELFQNYDRGQIEHYLAEPITFSKQVGVMVHFAETHDNNRLASVSIPYARMRTALCALLSLQGAFGFANGVEWYATEKIMVHEANSLNWGAEVNQLDLIQHLNCLLRDHPTFHPGTEISMVQSGEGNHLAVLRHHRSSGKRLLIVANLDADHETQGGWNARKAGLGSGELIDLLTGEAVKVYREKDTARLRLKPGAVLCLSPDKDDLRAIHFGGGLAKTAPERIVRQQLRAKALDVYGVFEESKTLESFDPDMAGQALVEDPILFLRKSDPTGDEPRVTRWQWPQDARRKVMVPPGHFLMIDVGVPFQAAIVEKGRVLAREEAIGRPNGTFFALFSPLPVSTGHFSCVLKLSVYAPDGCHHVEAPLLYLAPGDTVRTKHVFSREQIAHTPLLMLGTNGKGGMLRARVQWGELKSRYDALLAANLDPKIPEDRWIMFTRCRAWLVYQGYSQALDASCVHSFSMNREGQGIWHFRVPMGQGEHVRIVIGLEMIPHENAVRMVWHRQPVSEANGNLPDRAAVRLILRPDLEDRRFHDVTKAYTGPEERFPRSVVADDHGLRFAPDPARVLSIRISSGRFVSEPEWTYMVHREMDAERGQDPDSDLFSPGYFTASLKGGESMTLLAQINGPSDKNPEGKNGLLEAVKKNGDPGSLSPDASEGERGFSQTLGRALDHFVVRRGSLKSIIAGYPWFLDWGRDALIVVRALIASGLLDEARAVLKQFGRFELGGTLPNMIHGDHAGNRDTSDAPLWYVVCCAELVQSEGHDAFLDEPCGAKTIRETVFSIGRAYVHGIANGIRMDPGSGLIFSPPHFSWMDTQFPAGTPREGYPIEIQALWCSALGFLGRIDEDSTGGRWRDLAERVRSSLTDLFWMEEFGYLSDCLYAPPGHPPESFAVDDALRPNQLLAITLGAVEDKERCREVLASCGALLVPGAIRSLADRPVRRPLEIWHQNKPLNDPHHPYWGSYTGDEDTHRKPAYHNGTAWTWPFPAFCEAWAMVYGDSGRETARSLLTSASILINEGCIGQVPEIVDGDYPHTQRGCDAQAWGVSELWRVWIKLNAKT